jgi:hypothetical protein
MALTKVSYSMIDGAAVNFLDYGASTTATSAQNKTALVAALAASNSVYIPAGTYNIDGNINIKDKTVFGEPTTFGATTGSKLVLSGLNTNDTLFNNGGSLSSGWGTGGGCYLRDLYFVGNWDGVGSNPNTVTNIANIGALVAFFGGAYVIIQDCTFYRSFGFAIFNWLLGYSSYQTNRIFACAKNGIHITGTGVGNDFPTSSNIMNCSIGTIVGTDPTTGGSAIYYANSVGMTIIGNVLENTRNGIYIDGGTNRAISIIGNHIETYTVAGVNYAGSGQALSLFGNYFSTNTPPSLLQSNPLFTTYTAFGNNGIVPTIEGTLSSNIIQQYSTPTFSAGNFTSDAGTWVVESADVLTYQYQIINKTMTINFYIITSTVTGTPTQLRISVPDAKFSFSRTAVPFGYWDNQIGTGGVGQAIILPNTNIIILAKDIASTAWTNSTNQTYVWGQITFDIQ